MGDGIVLTCQRMQRDKTDLAQLVGGSRPHPQQPIKDGGRIDCVNIGPAIDCCRIWIRELAVTQTNKSTCRVVKTLEVSWKGHDRRTILLCSAWRCRFGTKTSSTNRSCKQSRIEGFRFGSRASIKERWCKANRWHKRNDQENWDMQCGVIIGGCLRWKSSNLTYSVLLQELYHLRGQCSN